MKSVAQFTQPDGRRVGIPALGGLIIMDVEKATEESVAGKPSQAKTLLRYTVGDTWRALFVKDAFKHVLSSMPLSAQGPWAHCTDHEGLDFALPRNCITAFEEIEDGIFSVTAMLICGPTTLRLKASLDDLVEHIGLVPDQPDPVVNLTDPAEEGDEHASDTGTNRVIPE